MTLLLWGIVGSMVGFLLWNLPPARLFLGDAGTLPIGFLMVFATLAWIDSGAPGASGALGAHAVPFADFLLVTVSRVRAHENPFLGGKDHSLHRLEVGVGAWKALFVLLLGCFAICFGGLMLAASYPLLVVISIPVASIVIAVGLSRLPPPRPAG
jgi:UDP-GlcNAc:undecaprenyl-phosphate GlcNAc-1-phosphate transferase